MYNTTMLVKQRWFYILVTCIVLVYPLYYGLTKLKRNSAIIYDANDTFLSNKYQYGGLTSKTLVATGALQNEMPNYELYVRYTATKEFIDEAKSWLYRSIILFWPLHTKIVAVFDDEKPADHKHAETLHGSYPKLMLRTCFMKPYPIEVIHGWGKARMYLDMMHADLCTKAEFVGFVDVDTLFITAATPSVLFENNKPVVTGRIGYPRVPCWIQSGEYILRKKQVMQCMSHFPVTFKMSHITEMRKYIEILHNKSFTQVFKETSEKLKVHNSCFCHYSLMCNYVWYHHREEYAWHLQMTWRGKWKGEDAISAMVDKDYFLHKIKDYEKTPMPRTSVHARHMMLNGKYMDAIVPSEVQVNGYIKEGLCYSFGFELCPNNCVAYNKTKIHFNIFAFENYEWQWDRRCVTTQENHYNNVARYLRERPNMYDTNSTCKLIASL